MLGVVEAELGEINVEEEEISCNTGTYGNRDTQRLFMLKIIG